MMRVKAAYMRKSSILEFFPVAGKLEFINVNESMFFAF